MLSCRLYEWISDIMKIMLIVRLNKYQITVLVSGLHWLKNRIGCLKFTYIVITDVDSQLVKHNEFNFFHI